MVFPLARMVGRSLEARPVEEPDRQPADEHDPQEDEDERDIGLALGIAAA